MLRRDFKRKRRDIAAGNVVAVYRASSHKRRRTASAGPFRPGRDRVGGFYGRYAGSNAELKFHDLEIDDAIIASGGVITDTVNVIPQGVTEVQRIGRKCTIRSIFWRGQLSLAAAELQGNPSSGERVRLIMYLDKQCNGATATALGILETVGVDNYRNLANSGRFSILYDHTVVLNLQSLSHHADNSFSWAGVKRNFSFMKKCSIPIEFDNTTGAISEVRSNNIGILIVAEEGTGTLVSSLRLRFSDA